MFVCVDVYNILCDMVFLHMVCVLVVYIVCVWCMVSVCIMWCVSVYSVYVCYAFGMYACILHGVGCVSMGSCVWCEYVLCLCMVWGRLVTPVLCLSHDSSLYIKA